MFPLVSSEIHQEFTKIEPRDIRHPVVLSEVGSFEDVTAGRPDGKHDGRDRITAIVQNAS